MTSTLPPLVQAVSGGLGAAISNTLVYPVDLISTRIQTKSISSKRTTSDWQDAVHIFRKIVQKHGYGGLYTGLESDTGATILSNFLYYYLYSALRDMLLRQQTKGSNANARAKKAAMLSPEQELVAGFLSGVGSRVVTIPLTVITVHLQSENENEKGEAGLGAVIKHIYKTQGLAGFWSGLWSTVILAVNPALTMLFFQVFRRFFLKGKDRERPTASQGFLGGALASSIAVLILYPLIFAKSRLQSYSKPGQPASMAGVWEATIRQQGVFGIYQGLQAQIVKGFLGQGATLMTKQRIEQILVALYSRSSPIHKVE